MKNSEIKHHIEVEGAILTEECLKSLKCMQDGNNEVVNSWLETIADAIGMLSGYENYLNEPYKKDVPEAIATLCYIRQNLKWFRKP